MGIASAFRSEITDELRDLIAVLSDLEDQNLTDWEFQFVASLQDRIEKYRGETVITPKQGEWISRLCEKYGIEP